VVLHLGYLDYHSYLAIASMTNLDTLPKGVKLDDVVFTVRDSFYTKVDKFHTNEFQRKIMVKFIFHLQYSYFSVSFTEVEIWFRFMFVVLTFMVAVSIFLLCSIIHLKQ
jgi:hypothetical protein